MKNPMVYTVVVPLLAGLWLLYTWAVAYPTSIENMDQGKKDYEEAQKMLDQILTLEPQRLSYQQEKGKTSEFDYTNVIDQFTKQFAIAPGDYTLTVRGATKKAGQTIKGADLSIKTIDIEKLCKFISALLIRWPELECERLAVEKLPAGKNNWKITLRLTYKY
ncbi:MAG: hypothetical protein ABFD91_13610 [Anaerohalosphaeraceae bacterium]